MYLLGFDIGSSSIKVSLVNARNSTTVGTAFSPETELKIDAPQVGWAEQDPEIWWKNACAATQKLIYKNQIDSKKIAAIGISYQMHGLVAVDSAGNPVRPAIIWCDSRAAEIGACAFEALGEAFCLENYLNAPGNFTAAKLRWVKTHEPEVFLKIKKIMWPGDFIALKMTGDVSTTVGGLSEGILWNFKENKPAHRLLDYFDLSQNLLPDLVPAFGAQGKLTHLAAAELGLTAGTPVTYRAGDQPNNALALNVLRPGEVAASGGTSGVVFGVVDRLLADPKNRINSFAHVHHSAANPRIGMLLCLNGGGIQHSWMRREMATDGMSFSEMERLAATVPMGAEGLRILPFGNGAERIFGNKNIGAQVLNLQFNQHGRAHLYRASLEGIAFSFVFGLKILKELGLNISVLRVGNDNLFQSTIFCTTISDLLDCRIELSNTTGATGAAIAAGVGLGHWANVGEGLGKLRSAGVFEPELGSQDQVLAVYEDWAARLEKAIKG